MLLARQRAARHLKALPTKVKLSSRSGHHMPSSAFGLVAETAFADHQSSTTGVLQSSMMPSFPQGFRFFFVSHPPLSRTPIWIQVPKSPVRAAALRAEVQALHEKGPTQSVSTRAPRGTTLTCSWSRNREAVVGLL